MYIPTTTCICSEIVVKSDAGGTSKVRSKIMIIKGNEAFAVCKGCGAEVRIPIKVELDAPSPPLLIKK